MSTGEHCVTGEGKTNWCNQSRIIKGFAAARSGLPSSGTRLAQFPGVVRITTQTEGKRTIVAIDGQMTEADLKEIQRVRNSITGAVVLNLRGLNACADDGVRFLRVWLAAGAKLQAATPFMEMILTDSQS